MTTTLVAMFSNSLSGKLLIAAEIYKYYYLFISIDV